MAIQLTGNKLVGLYETADPFTLQQLGPGVYTYLLTTGGNSLLSSLFVGNCPSGSSITVRYYSQTTGDKLNERTDLNAHATISSSQTSADQILVTRIHNKTYVEVEITGSPVTFGLEVTVISTFAVDLSASLELAGTPVTPSDRGLPIMGVDGGEFQFLPMQNGRVLVSSQQTVGTPLNFAEENSVAHGSDFEHLSVTVPAGKTWHVRSLIVSSVGQGWHALKADNSLAVKVRTGAGMPTASASLPVPFVAASGTVLTVTSRLVAVTADVSILLQIEEI